jgi:hypothetical protein
MGLLSGFADLIRDLLIVIGAMAVLLIVLLIVIWKMRKTSPVRRVLKLLAYRLGATVVAGAVAVPIEPIPVLDAIYDIGVPIVLIWYWLTLFREAKRGASPATLQLQRPSQPEGEHDRRR